MWRRPDISDDDLFPPLYALFRKDRTSRGSGIAVLVKSSLQATSVHEFQDIECICIRVSAWSHNFILCALYRPPDSDTSVEVLKHHMSQFRNSKILLVGDFNLPGVYWERFVTGPSNKIAIETIFDIMLTHNLKQVVDKTTRTQESTTTLLDLVFVHHEYEDCQVSVEQGLYPIISWFSFQFPYQRFLVRKSHAYVPSKTIRKPTT